MTDALYHDPDLVAVYDALNADRRDYDFYLSHMPAPPCRVLDVGCGTGTFAIEMARLGYDVIGLDPAGEMITAARAKTGAEAVSWHVGEVASLPTLARFDVAVMTGHAFQCLLSDAAVSDLFSEVSQRLHGSGAFWFETRNPGAKPWQRWMPECAGAPVSIGPGCDVHVVHQVLAEGEGRVTFEERYSFSDGREMRSESTLRFLTLDEIEALARQSGLRLVAVFGDWDGRGFEAQSPEIIVKLEALAV